MMMMFFSEKNQRQQNLLLETIDSMSLKVQYESFGDIVKLRCQPHYLFLQCWPLKYNVLRNILYELGFNFIRNYLFSAVLVYLKNFFEAAKVTDSYLLTYSCICCKNACYKAPS